jgi:nuclear pore complex protein Nup205
MGSTVADEGPVQHASIFDLFDFMDLDFSIPSMPTVLPSFEGIDLSVCLETPDDSLPIYNLGKVRELLMLRRSEIVKAGGLQNAQEEAMVNSQISDLVQYHAIDNQVKVIWASRLRVLQAWTQLVLLMIQIREFDGSNKGM